MTRDNSGEATVAQPGRDGVSNASRKGDQSRQRILEAALVEFGAAGFKSATTRRIAERANTTLPPLSYYFGSKEGLYRACAEEIVERYGRANHDAVARARRTIETASGADEAREALKNLMAASVDLIWVTRHTDSAVASLPASWPSRVRLSIFFTIACGCRASSETRN